jgi:hypothetical protein
MSCVHCNIVISVCTSYSGGSGLNLVSWQEISCPGIFCGFTESLQASAGVVTYERP